MIVVRCMGGLGNQMFQYAFGYCLTKKNNTVLKIDDTLLHDRSQPHEIVTHRTLDLADVFDLSITKASHKEISYFNGNTGHKNIFSKIKNSLLWRLRKHNLVIEKTRKFSPELLNTGNNKCLVGAWQSENYFSAVSDDIKLQYRFKNPLLEQSRPLGQNICTKNSVCLHVRRGDYVTSKLYNQTIGALSTAYYQQAIEVMAQKTDKPVFYVFSDDLNWCKENISIPFEHFYVEDIHVGPKASNYLQLMTLCKNHIISNSTFSWWAAWLAEKSSSVIIGPTKWFRDDQLDGSAIIPDRWIKL